MNDERVTKFLKKRRATSEGTLTLPNIKTL